jgi:VWFA-related protein
MPPSRALRLSTRVAIATMVIAIGTSVATQDRGQPLLRVSVDMVQVDVVVTDERGAPVTDLRQEDFQILQDGRLQQVSAFSYVDVPRATTTTAAAAGATAQAAPAGESAGPAAPLPAGATPSIPGNTLVIVVDDLSMTHASVHRTKQLLNQVIDEQIGAGDRVAIVRTVGGAGLYQQFTSDKARLREAVSRLRFVLHSDNVADPEAALQQEVAAKLPPARDRNEREAPAPQREKAFSEERKGAVQAERYANQIVASGVLGTLQAVLTGLRNEPGRKGVLLLSDGFNVEDENGHPYPYVRSILERVVDQAARSFAVIYSINVRRFAPMPNASLGVGTGDASGARTLVRDKALESFRRATDGPAYLADQTGGFFFANPSDLRLAASRSLSDQRGYYLLGYSPDARTAAEDPDGARFHRIEVRLTRPGLQVRARKGFLGRPGGGLLSAGSALADAALSSFTPSTLDLRLTSYFVKPEDSGEVVRSLLHIDASQLGFDRATEQELRQARLDLIALAIDERGAIIGQDRRAYQISTREAVAAGEGLVYRFDVPVSKAGPCYMRVAVRDNTSGRIGSAHQFVLVPDLEHAGLALSGIVIGASEAGERGVGAIHPALRRVTPPARLGYSVQIFNARNHPRTRRPALTSQVTLLRDDTIVYAGPVLEVQAAGAPGEPVTVGSSLTLGSAMPAGEYLLQLEITDRAEPDRVRRARQTVDFVIHR